ncbi:MAG: transglutaminase-like domain-containing protein [Thermodesulfobacteriota bacterium]
MIRAIPFKIILLFLLLTAGAGCAGRYFHAAGPETPSVSPYSLRQWPYEEYWAGIVFNGAKIGFSYVAVSQPDNTAAVFAIESEAFFRIRFLMLDKKVILKSFDQVGADLSLKRFVYDYVLDENTLQLTGGVVDGRLEVEGFLRGQTFRQSFELEGKLYPTSALGLYPVLQGLAVGRKHRYNVYDGQTRTIAPVEQEVLAYETSDLFEGAAFKVRTRLHGQEVLSWIDKQGKPLLEMSQGGVIISYLEKKRDAQKYLTQAAINKDENLLNYSLIKTDLKGYAPEQAASLDVVISIAGADFTLPSDERQQCVSHANGQFCRIRTAAPTTRFPTKPAEDPNRFLNPSIVIPSQHEHIRNTAAEIASTGSNPFERVGLLMDWIRRNIRQDAADVFSALDVLEGKKAECQGHAYLYTAFARSLGIPSRVVNGIVYSLFYQGFLYHTWAESLLDGQWAAVDPTFGQLPADATHIKLIEGEMPADLLPLVHLIGKVKMEIVAVNNP